MSKGKKVFITLIVGVSVLGIIGAGTYATFTAQVTNPNNKFANGTLVLSDKVNAGSVCLSTAGGSTDTNSNGSCDTIFSLSVKKPGDSGSANVTIKNEGSLDASVYDLFSSACTDADDSGESYHGTGSQCGAVELKIQEYDSSFTTPGTCIYGGASCAFSTSKTLGDFATNYGSLGSALSLSSLSAGTSKYYKFSVQLPSTAGNTVQGRKATMDFSWYASL